MTAPSHKKRVATTQERKARSKRKVTIAATRLSAVEVKQGKLLALRVLHVDGERPKKRSECEGGERPCPWVSCRYHLILDVDPNTGSLHLNDAPKDGEDWADVLSRMPATCVLDVADRSGVVLDEVGQILGLTRERIRQVETRALVKIKLGAPEPGELPDPAKHARPGASVVKRHNRTRASTFLAKRQLLNVLSQSPGPWDRHAIITALGLGASGANVITEYLDRGVLVRPEMNVYAKGPNFEEEVKRAGSLGLVLARDDDEGGDAA